MNPHFIFNVLNSIKTYIYENDKARSIQYLNSFSELIRLVLRHSAGQQVGLEDELRLLNRYIELEAMLLEGEFSYDLQVDPNLDTTITQIPGLLLQPLVENAFKHGLRHRHGPKQLRITCKLLPSATADYLLVEVHDNGMGRRYAAQHQPTTHESFASAALERRLQLINSGVVTVVDPLQYQDLYNPDGSPAGTVARLKIRI
jgi:LytS/YehU family sensor histidine kinase